MGKLCAMRTALFSMTLLSAMQFPSFAFAEPDVAESLADTVDTAVVNWMTAHGIANAAVAVSAHGHLIKTFDHGFSAHSDYAIGSLSKAITGFCVSKMLDGGKLRLSDTIGLLLHDYFEDSRNPKPVDRRFKSITIEQLLTHRSGLVRNAFGENDASIEDSFRSTTQTPLRSDPGSSTDYSNSGYLVLGYIAQTIAGRDYQAVCGDFFARLTGGVTGSIDPQLMYRAPNGGWIESAANFAKFIGFMDPETKGLGPVSREWLYGLAGSVGNAVSDNGVDAAPCAIMGGSPAYGFGACVQRTAKGYRSYHNGAVVGRPGGSTFVVNEAGYAAVVIFDAERNYKQLFDALDRVLSTPQAYADAPR